MKIIKVDSICKINQDNVVNCREGRLVAINVVRQVEDEKGFVGYCLATDSEFQNCEQYGVELIVSSDYNDDSGVYVDRIEQIKHESRVLLSSFGIQINETRSHEKCGGGVWSFVYGENDEILAIGCAYNIHNGYYPHEVFTDINGETVVDSL